VVVKDENAPLFAVHVAVAREHGKPRIFRGAAQQESL
jgi:hypothetical protein